MLRTSLLCCALLFFARAAWADYVVLVGVEPKDPYYEAAARLAAHHGTKHVLPFDVDDPTDVLPKLREIAPENVAVVLRPSQIDVNAVRRILRMSTQVDDDPFCDFSFGYVTGATAEEAVAFVDRIVKASKRKQPRQVARASVGGGSASRVAEETYELGELRFPYRTLKFVAPDEEHGRDQAFIDDHMKDLEGTGAILLGGHGMPWEIGSGPRAEDLAGLDLFPAVAFNYACYTGVTHRWPQREFAGREYVFRIHEVEAERSFALAMIRAGVTGYVGYVNPRPAGPEMTIDFERTLAGETLGATRRNDYAKIALGYLGYAEPGIVPPHVTDGERVLRSKVDAVRHLMLDGGTGGILYGDPAFRPYPETPRALPLRTDVNAEGDDLHVTLSMSGSRAYLWCADPYRRFDEQSMAMKLYDRVELAEDAPEIRSVRVAEATAGGQAVETIRPVWAVEVDQGRRYLHVKAGFRRGARGDVRVHLVASPDAAPLDLTEKADCVRLAAQVGEHVLAHLEALEDAWVYDGRAGVAHFLWTLHAVTKDDRWRAEAAKLLDAAEAETGPPGLYVGRAGVGQVLLDAWHATNDPEYLERAKRVAASLGAPEGVDVISGAAGTGIFLLNLHAATGAQDVLDSARELGALLAASAVREEGRAHWPISETRDHVYVGFSHGAAGVGYFLVHLARATGDDEHLALAREAAAFVVARAVEDPPDGWKWTKRNPPLKDYYPVQWCHGSPGIGLFFLALADATGEPEHEAALARCVAAARRRGRTARAGGCFCHGKAGNAEFLVDVAQRNGDETLVDEARAWALDLVDGDEVRTAIGEHEYGPGLMTGLAGIGRFLLRLSDPGEVPAGMMVSGGGADPLLETVRAANKAALRPGAASNRAVSEVAKLGPGGFRAVCRLIAAGEGHYRTHELLRATWYPGGERLLQGLADGPSLPGYGKWTALRGLGVADTPEVRAYLLGRIERERDAGLFMSVAQALGMLKEGAAAEPLGRQLLRFEERWSGVERHLVAALGALGERAAPHLEAFLADPRATNEASLLLALRSLHALDPGAAKEAAAEIKESTRFTPLGEAAKAAVERMAETR